MIIKKYVHSKKETSGVFFGNGTVKINTGVSKDGTLDEYPVVLCLTDSLDDPKEIGKEEENISTSDDEKRETITLFFKNEEGLDVLIDRLIIAKLYFKDVNFFKEKMTKELNQKL